MYMLPATVSVPEPILIIQQSNTIRPVLSNGLQDITDQATVMTEQLPLQQMHWVMFMLQDRATEELHLHMILQL